MPRIIASESDVFSFLGALQGADVNGACFDPPYDTLDRYRRTGTTTRLKDSEDSSNPWFKTMPIEQLCDVMRLVYGALAPNAYVFVYVDEPTAYRLAHRLGVSDALDKLVPTASSRAPVDKIGFGWWTSAVWAKTSPKTGEVMGGMGYHLAQAHERILLLEKGRAPMMDRFPNVLLAPKPAAKPKGTTIAASTPKPISITTKLARAMAAPGSTLLDWCTGSGTSALAFVQAGSNALVNDVNLSCFRDWMRAYQAGEAEELIQETGGKLDFDLRYVAGKAAA